MPRYHPRGEMCLACVNLLAKCNHLPFSSMKPVLEKYTDEDGEWYVVRCSAFKRKTHEKTKP